MMHLCQDCGYEFSDEDYPECNDCGCPDCGSHDLDDEVPSRSAYQRNYHATHPEEARARKQDSRAHSHALIRSNSRQLAHSLTC